MVQLNYRDAKPIYEQIKEGIRRLVISNVLVANEKLPSVRELASKLAINPNTIFRAYRELEEEGYIYSINGKGTFVSEREDGLNARKDELMGQFDEVVEELLTLQAEELYALTLAIRVGNGVLIHSLQRMDYIEYISITQITETQSLK